ncbi:hypothetical protein IJ114_03115 [Candidatus Saccharibacteria bacterium]|nr:hypothetical protein [Candidatus Saccharibacteria bacterium]
MLNQKELITEVVDHWDAPQEDDARILSMPVIPAPMFLQAPRNFMGRTERYLMRKECLEKANYKCATCGHQGSPYSKDCTVHELYSIDYKNGIMEFARPVCLCPYCHFYIIHVGKALTEHKHGNPLYSTEKMITGFKNGFKAVSTWNNTHNDDIKLFSAILNCLKDNELREPLEKLIVRYDLNFYAQPLKRYCAPWDKWILLYNGKKYHSPFKDSYDQKHHFERNNNSSTL